MSSKGITETRDDRSPAGGWQAPGESAPSLIRQEEPGFARGVGLLGVFLLVVGALVLILGLRGNPFWTRYMGFSVLGLVLGTICLLFHAVSEKEQQLRRLYGLLGALCLVAGVVFMVLPLRGISSAWFFYGALALMLGLLFLLSFLRNEEDVAWRTMATRFVGGSGALMSLIGILGSTAHREFLAPYGIVLILLGLCYLWSFVALQGTSDKIGYYAGIGIGVLGGLIILSAVLRACFDRGYLLPTGERLILLGIIHVLLSVALISEAPFVVLTRREVSSMFYSPMVYFVLVGFTLIAWLGFSDFIRRVVLVQNMARQMSGQPMYEPIIEDYFINWQPVVAVVFMVPVLTMRLLSEERRTATLEVLLTAPVKESTVVLSKFAAALIFFLLAWLPWGLYLVAMRVETGTAFDTRPLDSFFYALVASGAGFLAMGVFFSSLTRNQIAAAVLTGAGMLLMFGLFFAWRQASRDWGQTDTRTLLLAQVSFLNLWIDSLSGKLIPKNLLFHLSAAVFWLFLTVKVLEARKWT